jgi:hypothetical protein
VAIHAVVWELYGQTQTVDAGVDVSFAGTLPPLSLSATITTEAPVEHDISFAGTLPPLSLAATIETAPATTDISFAGTLPPLSLAATVLVTAGEVADPPLTPVVALTSPAAGAVQVNNTNTPDPNADDWAIEWHDGDGQWEPLASTAAWPYTHTPGGGEFTYRVRGRRWVP